MSMIEIFALAASVWTLVQAGCVITGYCWLRFRQVASVTFRYSLPFKTVSRKRLDELEKREEALRMLIDQIDAFREAANEGASSEANR